MLSSMKSLKFYREDRSFVLLKKDIVKVKMYILHQVKLMPEDIW